MAKQTKQAKIQVNRVLSMKREQAEQLAAYLKDRIDYADAKRQRFVDKLQALDRELAGLIKLDLEDQKRKRQSDAQQGVQVTDFKLPFVLVQMDEAATALLQILAPDSGMYSAQAPREQQQIAKGFSALMNKHAEQFGHYENVESFITDVLSYNLGGLAIEWRAITGNRLTNASDPTGMNVQIIRDVVRQGNELRALDMYNFIWDPSVRPHELHDKGEFGCEVRLFSEWQLHRMRENAEIFDLHWLNELKRNRGATQDAQLVYYKRRPDIPAMVGDHEVQGSDASPNWRAIFSGKQDDMPEAGSEIELLFYTGWIQPAKFGLPVAENSRRDAYEIWHVVLAVISNERLQVVFAQRRDNAHAQLPFALAQPFRPQFGTNYRSYAEFLIPLNRFSSFQFNMHQRAARKALYGVNFFNELKIPILKTNPQRLEYGWIPVSGDVEDIGRHVKQVFDAPSTDNTLRDIDATDNIMQKILPTDMLKQVTDLERATRYQAAATVQGSNRRLLKIAKIIDSQALTVARELQMYNILQYQTEMQVIDPSGALITVNPSEFRDAQLEFVIADGLRGIDKLALIEGMKDVIAFILQSQTASKQIDVVALINYWTSLLGDRTDFSQFKYQSPFDQLTLEQKQLALQLLQQAQQQAQGGGQAQ